eukprot:1965594-Pleurochrysis_carterae.AAC.1
MRSSRADWEREGTSRTVSILKAGKREPPVPWAHAMRGRRRKQLHAGGFRSPQKATSLLPKAVEHKQRSLRCPSEDEGGPALRTGGRTETNVTA